MTWNSTQPLPTQLISQGQATILNNFAFLGSTTGNVTPGFYKLPNGLKLVWGETTIAATTSRVITYTVAQAFTTATFNIQVTRIAARPSATNPQGNYVQDTSITNAGFRIVNDGAVASGFYWFAIGI